MRTLFFLLAMTAAANAGVMEQCSYSTKYSSGEITHTAEAPSEANGSNQERFARIIQWEKEGQEGWKGYTTFDVKCRPLDDKKVEFHLFVQTENGQISLVHGLTESACYQALLLSDTHRNMPSGSSWSVQGGDFKQGSCFK
jgi:hypothetical protein